MSVLKQVEVDWLFTPNDTEAFNSSSNKTLVNINHLMINIPKANNLVLDHTGSELTQEFTNLTQERINVSGDTSGTNTGEYTTVFGPKYGCEWPDETKESKEVNWYISDQINQFTVDKSGTVTDLTEEIKESETIIFPNKGLDEDDEVQDIKAIGSNLLKDNESVKSVVIPESVDEIKENAFSGCNSLEEIVIPESVTKIGDNAFNDCISLEKINYKGTEEEWDNIEVGTGNNNLLNLNKVKVPSLINSTLSYSGSVLTPEFNGYAKNKISINGDSSGIEVGEYTVIFTLKEGYEWSDGTREPKEVKWYITKATPVVTSVTTPTDKEYGVKLSEIVPIVDSNVEGTLTWTTSEESFANMLSPATVTWLFTPNDTDNYNTLTGESTIIIDEIDITVLPSQNGTLTYNGNELVPSWNNYDTNQMTISGVTKGTNAGEYKAVFTPTEKYEWGDGTREPKEVTWTIAKTAGSLSLNATSATLQTNGTTSSTVTVTRSGNGAITATSSNTGVATVAVSGTTVTITQVGRGTATITVKVAAGTNHTAPSNKTVAVTVNTKITTVPSQNGTLTYTGSEQTVSWSNYNSSQLTLGGTTKGTNAGSYTATFTPKANYCWSDGSTSAKSVTWTIAKAAGSLSLNATSATLQTNGTTSSTVTVTRSGNGAITATSSNTGVATVAVSGTTVTITAKGRGSSTITVKVAAGTNHTAPSNKTVAVTVNTKITTVPSQKTALISNGSEQTVSWNNYNSSQLTLGGTTKGTNAGSYTATFTPKANYCWSDGSTSAKNVKWNINYVDFEVTSSNRSKVGYTDTTKTLNIPSTFIENNISYKVTSIGEDAFYNCTSLTSVTIPNSVTTIGDYAFNECAKLTTVNIPNSVTSIGNYLFQNCESLTSISIGNGVTSITKYSFYGCTLLESVTIGSSVTSIGDHAFYGCNALKTANIPNGVITIDKMAFGYCTSLTSVTIPNSVTTIGDYAFNECAKLTTVNIPNSVTSIGYSAFYYCKALKTVTIGNGVTSIGKYAFYDCNILTTVNYRGTTSQWNAITIEANNDPLLNATKVYNYKG